MTIQQEDGAPRIARRIEEAATASPASVDMSLLSNAPNYVDENGIGHVKVDDSVGWSGNFPNDSTVRIVYEGSGSSGEIFVVRAGQNVSGSEWTSGSRPIDFDNTLPTGLTEDSNLSGNKGLVRTGTNSVILVVVGTSLALIAIVSALAVVVYSRRNRRRAYSKDMRNSNEPFIVGSLPKQPVSGLSVLDTDMSPDLWLEGQYRYSPNMSQLENSLNGTAILSDNHADQMHHHRLTFSACPSSRLDHRRNGGRVDVGRSQRKTFGRDHAEDSDNVRDDSLCEKGAKSRVNGGQLDNNVWRDYGAHRDHGILDDISDRGRRRRGTTPIVLYDESSAEESKSNSSRIRRVSQPSLSPQQQRVRYKEQQRQRRRDKFATRRDR